MSDQSSPPPKKVGSLRDRIAAFEKSASSAAPSGPGPAPRPKPAGFASWKPKPPSPPSSPPAGTTEHAGSPRAAGLSASDAKDSITKAGSLKERMAALQGKGAFGAPPPVAPKPTVERPKWKPPPVVHAPADEEDHAGEGSTAAIAAAVEKTISPPTSVKSRESAEPHPEGEETAPPTGGDDEGEAAADPEEEERQRRAAIAARMARLGGARVGMAPPVFGRKPPARRPTQEEVPAAEEPKEQPKVEVASHEPIKSAETVASPPAAETVSPPAETLPAPEPETRQPLDGLLARKNSEGASILSSESPEAQAAKNPSSMPIPAVPRRTGPPRKKPAKPATPPTDVPEEVIEEKLEVPPAALEAEPKMVSDEATVDASKDLQATSSDLEHDDVKHEVHEETPRPSTRSPVQVEPVPEATPEPTKHEEVSPSVAVGVSGPHPAPPPPVSPPVHEPPSEISDFAEETSGVKPPPPSLATGVLGEEDDDDSEDDTGPASKASVAFPPHPTQLPIDLVDKELEEEIKDGTITPGDNQEEVDEEAEEEARRKRIAERLGNMGGVNPFAPPPMQTKVSTGSEATSPPLPSSPAPVALPPRSPEPVQPTRKESIVIEQPKPEESDSDYDEEAFLDDKAKPPPAVSTSTQEQEERPESTKVLAANQTGFTPQSSPPPIPSSTRPHVEARPDAHEGVIDVENQPVDRGPEVSSSPADHSKPSTPPPSRSVQQPRRLVPPAPEDDEELEGEGADQTDEEADERLAQSHLFIPPPTDRALAATHPRRANIQDEDDGAGDGSENDSPALPVLHRRSMEAPPPTTARRQVPQPLSDEEEEDENALESDHDGRALPIPPPHLATVTTMTAPKTAERKASGPPPRLVPPPPPARPPPAGTLSPSNLTPSLSVSGSEVLDEEEGDPIDPSFHSPSRQTSQTNLRAQAQAQAPVQVQTTVAAVTQPPAPPVHSPTPPARSLPPARSPPLPSAPPARSSPPVHHSPPPVRSPQPAHSPPPTTLPPLAYPGATAAAEPKEELEEDSEQLRRKTIAERMAKLGGIRFGAAPLPTPASRPPPPPARHEEEGQEQERDKPTEEEETPAELTEEEEEKARKERIAAKLASMGGMRIGMMPMGMGGLPPQRSHVLSEEPPSISPTATYAAPPTRAVPPARPPPPPAQPPQLPDTDSEYGSAIASDDGVKVEVEESEIEEVNYEDAEPEEVPPPIPSRSTRPPAHRQESTEKPTSPPPRPPVPSGIPVRRSSVQTTRSTSTSETGPIHPQRKTSSSYVPPAQSDYVMVEEPEAQEAPPPPVRRLSRPPPTRSAPQVPQAPLSDPKDSISSQWELPSIPTSSFDFEGGGADLSLSWTDAGEPTSPSSSMHPSSPPPPQPPTKAPAQQQQRKASLVDRPMSADDLMALWGRVGVQVCEVATTLFERSKKALIGDGTYAGFVATVLAGVPNAAPIPILVNRSSSSSAPTPDAHSNANEHTYGYLIYVQSGAAVQRRASEIMPGDIVEIHDGKLKGHKGIQMYHQNVGGDGETLVGIVGEFEAKKSKIRVFHANQHVGQQTVESVSYRLEDLKSGAVKVYRVLEA